MRRPDTVEEKQRALEKIQRRLFGVWEAMQMTIENYHLDEKELTANQQYDLITGHSNIYDIMTLAQMAIDDINEVLNEHI